MAYAKYDQDFKKTLIHYIPFIEPILEDSSSSGNIVSEYYKNAKSSLFGLFTGSKDSETFKSKSGAIIEKTPEPQQYKGKSLR